MSSQGIPQWQAQEGGTGTTTAHGAFPADSVPYFSTVPYKGDEPKRDERKCTANGNTCKAWKAAGTDLCVGHMKKESVDAKPDSE